MPCAWREGVLPLGCNAVLYSSPEALLFRVAHLTCAHPCPARSCSLCLTKGAWDARLTATHTARLCRAMCPPETHPSVLCWWRCRVQ